MFSINITSVFDITDMSVTFSPNDFRITIGHVEVSANNILSFTLKEECSNKIPDKNTYIVKVQGIEMNNLSRVDKTKIEDGVFRFHVDLTPVVPVLNNGQNTLEVEGTANMLVNGAGSLDGFYALTCGQTTMSIFSGNGLFLPASADVPAELVGFYSRRVTGTDSVVYEKFSDGNKYVIFFFAPQSRWFIKQTIANGVSANIIYYQQNSTGTQTEVPLANWREYVSGSISSRCIARSSLALSTCMPFESTDILLVNCGGLDEVNGCYYRDGQNSQFVNVRNPNIVIRYVIDDADGSASWQIQDISNSSSPAALYQNTNVVATNSACANCIPCCQWEALCTGTPGDPPQVTALEYFDQSNPSHNIKYFDNGSSTWSLFDGNMRVATGTSSVYIVVRTLPTNVPNVNGAYTLTGATIPPDCPTPSGVVYTQVLDSNVTLEFVGGRWEIRNSGVTLYFNDSTDPSVPPFDGWIRAVGVSGEDPLVLSSVVPSCVCWTLL